MTGTAVEKRSSLDVHFQSQRCTQKIGSLPMTNSSTRCRRRGTRDTMEWSWRSTSRFKIRIKSFVSFGWISPSERKRKWKWRHASSASTVLPRGNSQVPLTTAQRSKDRWQSPPKERFQMEWELDFVSPGLLYSSQGQFSDPTPFEFKFGYWPHLAVLNIQRVGPTSSLAVFRMGDAFCR